MNFNIDFQSADKPCIYLRYMGVDFILYFNTLLYSVSLGENLFLDGDTINDVPEFEDMREPPYSWWLLTDSGEHLSSSVNCGKSYLEYRNENGTEIIIEISEENAKNLSDILKGCIDKSRFQPEGKHIIGVGGRFIKYRVESWKYAK